MKIIYMGTPEFAVPTLIKCSEKHEILAVFTQPDKPKGRGNKMVAPPVKVEAALRGIPVYQPERIKRKEWVETIKALDPDVIVVVAYGQLLSKEILDIPVYGCINVHGSLLPKFRGAAPIQWAVASGESETGITTMLMDVGLDTGDMLLKAAVPILPEDNAGTMHDKLSVLGADVLIETLDGILKGEVVPIVQSSQEATHAPLLNKDIACVDWNMTAVEIANRVRGFNPWPVTHTQLAGVTLKIFKASSFETENSNALPGTVVRLDPLGIYVQTGRGVIRLDEIQLGSNKRMSTASFLLGHHVEVGIQLGEKEDCDVLR